jgi:Glu-tRNA(Gln) amidotransferase subunit E-like FAD-binding protein
MNARNRKPPYRNYPKPLSKSAKPQASRESADMIVKEKGLVQVSDESEIEKAVDEVLARNPDSTKRSGLIRRILPAKAEGLL